PTKTMVASARVAYLARRGGDYGVRTGAVSVDQARVRERKRAIVGRWRSGGERSLRTAGVDLLMGEASFTGPKTLEVRLNDGGIRALAADPIFINAGARPAKPPVAGLEGAPRILAGSHLLVAAGRVPNTDRLNLDKAGVRTDRQGNVQVNDRLETTAPGVYALGDVKGGPAFTHISYDDFRIIETNVLKGGRVSTKDRLVPYTVFIDP